jgi:hypothetical protein
LIHVDPTPTPEWALHALGLLKKKFSTISEKLLPCILIEDIFIKEELC